MDLWITLRDGRTAPLAGVTAVRSIDAAGTATSYPGSSITSGSAFVQVTSTAGIRPGSQVFGSGIPTGATVIAINTATTFTLSSVATATINPVTLTILMVTDATLSLLTINSGWYRDIFTPKGISISSASNAFGTNGTVLTMTATTASDITLNSATGVGVPGYVGGDPTPANSDEIIHAPLRRASWLEALWAFDCTVDADTLTLYYRKYEVVGFCNVAPSL